MKIADGHFRLDYGVDRRPRLSHTRAIRSLLRGLPVALLALANFVTADALEAVTASVSRVTITAASLAEGSLIGADDQPECKAHRSEDASGPGSPIRNDKRFTRCRTVYRL